MIDNKSENKFEKKPEVKSEEKSIKTPELLAPAGNMQALHAAVCAGADAVYLGLDNFNARQGADNFTLQSLKEACDYAHLRGVKIYVTLNTIIFNNEFDQALSMAVEATKKGADAFIVQDIGLAQALSDLSVDSGNVAPLHVSTQMNIHNEAGLRAVASLGAKRVTLAREMSVPEIEKLCKISEEIGMEIETFAHGAICVCYSGQCLMSSMIGERSANRGTCAQACRLNYELCGGHWNMQAGRRKSDNLKENKQTGNFLLSPKDLCTIEILPELVQAGVSSLKIEGRMKSPEYVFAVVSAYRAALNRIAAEGLEAYSATEAEKQALAQAFSRGFTTAYMEGKRGNEIMSYKRPNNRGVSIGRVTSTKFVQANQLRCILEVKQHVVAGDVLEIWTNKGRANIMIDKNARIDGNRVMFTLDMRKRENRGVRKSDRVFRVRSAADFFTKGELEPKVKVNGQVKLKLWEPAEVSFEVVQDLNQQSAGQKDAGQRDANQQNTSATAYGDIVETARTKVVTEQDVKDHIMRTGNTPFEIENLEIQLDDGVGIGFSALHKLRSVALQKLEAEILKPYSERHKSVDWSKAPSVKKFNQYNTKRKNVQAEICVLATNPQCARAAKRLGVEAIYVPALNFKRGTLSYAGCASREDASAGYPSKSAIMLPTVLHDSIAPALEAKKQFCVDEFLPPKNAARAYIADSLSDVALVLGAGGNLEIGPHLPVVNCASARYFRELGAQKIWLSPELSLSQIKQIAGKSIAKDIKTQFGLTVIGMQELMITEHCELMSAGNCSQNCKTCPRRMTPHFLKDRLGYEFPVVTDILGRSHVYNSVQLDVCHALGELMDAGVSAFMVDSTLMTPEQTAQAVGRLKSSLQLAFSGKKPDKVRNTTTGHLFKSL